MKNPTTILLLRGNEQRTLRLDQCQLWELPGEPDASPDADPLILHEACAAMALFDRRLETLKREGFRLATPWPFQPAATPSRPRPGSLSRALAQALLPLDPATSARLTDQSAAFLLEASRLYPQPNAPYSPFVSSDYHAPFYLGGLRRDRLFPLEHEDGLCLFYDDEDEGTLSDRTWPWWDEEADLSDISPLSRLTDAFGTEPNEDPWCLNSAPFALRAWLCQPPAERLTSLHLRVRGGLQPFEQVLQEANRLEVLTHLWLAPQREVKEPPLNARFPALEALVCPDVQLSEVLADGLAGLKSLVIERQQPDLGPLLHQLAALSLPALKHLALWYQGLTAEHLQALLALPLIHQLESLDLWTVNEARDFPFASLLAARPALGHLRRLVLPGHTLFPEVRRAWAEYPSVVLAGYDRGELLAHDLENLGWAQTL